MSKYLTEAWLKAHLKKGAKALPDLPLQQHRPRTRGDCRRSPRPCPFVSCRWHLYLEVTSTGAVKLTFPDLEVDELPETCALDVADRGPHTLEDIGRFMGVTRERARQIEAIAMDRIYSKHNAFLHEARDPSAMEHEAISPWDAVAFHIEDSIYSEAY